VTAILHLGNPAASVSTLQTQPPMIADELRRQADQFIDLADLEKLIGRDRSTRPVREPASRAAYSRAVPAPPATVLDYPDEDGDER
jgi:hypothetical protein